MSVAFLVRELHGNSESVRSTTARECLWAVNDAPAHKPV
jgi:hypothetical protein